MTATKTKPVPDPNNTSADPNAIPGHRQRAYKMPLVYVSQIVLWYDNGVPGEGSAYPAIVYSFNADSVNLGVFMPETLNVVGREGVRHVNDPEKKSEDLTDSGAWDYTEEYTKNSAFVLQLTALQQAFDKQNEHLTKLERQIETLQKKQG